MMELLFNETYNCLENNFQFQNILWYLNYI